ncbi:NAD(P)/FAD-dependent oxidoreductase [Mucilaginibacter limnophilus]|uniref:NAD(P)/FAD-dependent oxidoreductase n=1 Tax=Mucilaginibacter limnophilus TaxID=1932778 RepID=A0A3S2UKB3_9SPHI|nr:NAD(P)/FAD-dependent oxidoreductase [Mucilaginibacter limnophilus]RVT98524.1 NAD(P)/FAD-dependent oxidoreductase [Mucilaginibacter limnophilus]
METQSQFDVIIIGGSSAGLSAGLALGRALRKVLIIDNGKPCNRQTPHSHNFLTHDGHTPADIMEVAKRDVQAYPTVQFLDATVTDVTGHNTAFTVTVNATTHYYAGKIIFATGVKDIMPYMEGFAECWGISVIHCPYCHGYEYRGKITGILANGDTGFELAKMISNWTDQLTLFTNGAATFTDEQHKALIKNNIRITDSEISHLIHKDGYIEQVVFKDEGSIAINALYARLPFVQHTDAPEKLGCEFTEQGHIKIDMINKTSVPGVFACGDNTTAMRTLSAAIASGTLAGVAVSKDLTQEQF